MSASNGNVLVTRYDEALQRSTVQILSIEDGAAKANFTVDGFVTDGVITEQSAFVIGTAGKEGETDLGVLRISVEDGSQDIVIQSGPMPERDPAGWPGFGGRGPIKVSDSRGLLAVQRCDNVERCHLQIVQLGSDDSVSDFALPAGSSLLGVTDDRAIVRDATSVRGIDLATGREAWAFEARSLASPSAGYVSADAAVVAYIPLGDDKPSTHLTVLRASDGKALLDTTVPSDDVGAAPWPEFSDRAWTVLGLQGSTFGETYLAEQPLSIALVDLATGDTSLRTLDVP